MLEGSCRGNSTDKTYFFDKLYITGRFQTEKFKQIMILVGVLLLGFAAYARPPKVIKAIPDNGQRDVDPFLKQIRIEFDQEMSNGEYSICGDGKAMGKPEWANDRTFVAAIKLEPNREYEMSINCPGHDMARIKLRLWMHRLCRAEMD